MRSVPTADVTSTSPLFIMLFLRDIALLGKPRKMRVRERMRKYFLVRVYSWIILCTSITSACVNIMMSVELFWCYPELARLHSKE